MKQLPNGNFEIENVSTGEKREVTAADLPQYGLKAPDSTLENVGTGLSNVVKGVTDFLGLQSTAGNISLMTNARSLNDKTNETRQLQDEAIAQHQTLMQQIKQTTDPVEKKRLLAQDKLIFQQVGAAADELNQETEDYKKYGNVTDEEMKRGNGEFAARRGIGQTGELAVYALPGLKVGKGASAVGRIGMAGVNGALTGAEMAGIAALTNKDGEISEKPNKVLEAMIAGGTIGGVLGIAGRTVVEGGKRVIENQKVSGVLKQILRPSSPNTRIFERNTGLNFEDELVKRHRDEIVGMNLEQMNDFFEKKLNEAEATKIQTLAKSGKTINKNQITGIINDAVAGLQPEEGNIGTSEAIGKLQGFLDDLDKNPTELPLWKAERIKKQVQDTVNYSLTGGKSANDRVVKETAAKLNDLIDDNAGNTLKDVNKSIQLYHLARDAASNTLQVAGRKTSTNVVTGLLNAFPLLMGTLTTLGSGGNVGAGMAAATGAQMLRVAKLELNKPENALRIANVVEQKAPGMVQKLGGTQPAVDYFRRWMLLQIGKSF